MSRHILPVADVLRPHVEAYQRAAWFLWEWLEREQLRALNAWAAAMPRAALGYLAMGTPAGTPAIRFRAEARHLGSQS